VTSQPFQGSVAVVTGAASGIGFGIAQRFAEEGAGVALLDRDEEGCRAACERIRSSGGSCEAYPTDVADERQVIGSLNAVLRRFEKVDHLVNNAGVVLVKGIADCTAAEWDFVMNVNVKSVFLTTKYLLPALRASSRATVVNIGSVSSFVAQQQTPAYVASKGAVLMLSKALALDLAPYGIRVNCVCPGITDTPMLRLHANATGDPDRTLHERCRRVPLRRMLSPKEIANAVLYLSGDQSSGITGTTLVVDAGYTSAAEWSSPEGSVS
jgi:NAD(P)-dependent dehydrogenase (short-subunit alcohol dehydrogenase family)